MCEYSELFGNARWISASDEKVFPLIRQSFVIEKVPSSARLNIVGFGGFSVSINGARVTENLFLPLNTDFEERDFPSGEKTAHRIICESFSVAPLLREGKNVISVLLGEGWYTGVAQNAPFGGKKLCFRIFDEESGAELAVSDLGAKWTRSFVVGGEFDRGERQDFSGWSDAAYECDFDDSDFDGVCEARAPVSKFELSDCPRDRVVENISPRLLSKDAKGALYDAGVNLSGYPVLRASCGRVSVRFSELLNSDGTLSEFHGHGQYLEYTLDGAERLLFPRFAWIGFRYFYVEGDAEAVSVARVHADVKPSSDFSSDNETLNWLYRAYINTQLCNMHNGIPSDCPHIERCGYTGDGQLVARASMLSLDARSFYRKWINDISDCRDRLSGHVQYTAPYTHSGGGPGGWGSAIVTLPYEFWKRYGDEEPMRENFDAMLEYFRYMEEHSESSLVVRDRDGEWCLGDWCTPGTVILPAPFVNNYFYIKAMQRACEIAEHIGRTEILPTLTERIEERRRAIVTAYFNKWDGNFLGNVQGANAYAIDIGLGDERTKRHFIEHYEQNPYYDTGIFGTDIVTRVLFEEGRADIALRLLTASEPHGFGLWKNEDATSLWEYWDYYKDLRTRSCSHPMFGAVVAYFYDYLLGIKNRSGSVGYEKIDIQPVLVDALSRVSGHITAGHGKIFVGYERKGGEIEFYFEIPEKTEARIILPNGERHGVLAGNYSFRVKEN